MRYHTLARMAIANKKKLTRGPAHVRSKQRRHDRPRANLAVYILIDAVRRHTNKWASRCLHLNVRPASCARPTWRRKGGIATWVLTCQNQNGVVVDMGNQVNNLRPPSKTACSRALESRRKAKDPCRCSRRVSLFQTCCLSWLLAPWLYQVLGISWSVVFSSSELWATWERILRKISELERRGSEDGERRDDSPWRERRRAVGKVLPAE